MAVILGRQYYGDDDCYDNYGYYTCGNSTWDRWARWLVLALIIIAAILIFFLFSCISARRRRRMGYAPYRGTQWTLGRTPEGHGAAQYAPQQEQSYIPPTYNNSNHPAPPPYNAANDYYGGRNDVELQEPQAAYKPPQGPPPTRRY